MRDKTVSYLFFFLLLLLIVSSCQNRPKEVLKRKNMEQLMYDIYIAEATLENDYGNFNTPEKKEALIQALLLTILGLRPKVSGPQSGPFFKKLHEFI